MKKYIIGILLIILSEVIYLSGMISPSFGSHMALHMMVIAIAPAIVALGLPLNLRNRWSQHSNLFSPLNASVFELILVWAWHAPLLHHFARTTISGFVLEQGSFIVAGLWLWVSCVVNPSKALGVIGLLLTSMHMTFLGALISLSSFPLYHHSLQDQQLGGGIMLVLGGITYLWGGVYFAKKVLNFKISKGAV